MRRDIPKRWVLGDESIIEVARRAPATDKDLADIRGIPEKFGRGASDGVLAAVARGVALPDDQLPVLAKRRRPAGDIDGAVDLMVALVRLRAREHGVAMPLLASRDELERLAAGERDASPLLVGWRHTMVGAELLDLLDGAVVLSLDQGRLQVVKNPRSST
jgi:ribonuclease D